MEERHHTTYGNMLRVIDNQQHSGALCYLLINVDECVRVSCFLVCLLFRKWLRFVLSCVKNVHADISRGDWQGVVKNVVFSKRKE